MGVGLHVCAPHWRICWVGAAVCSLEPKILFARCICWRFCFHCAFSFRWPGSSGTQGCLGAERRQEGSGKTGSESREFLTGRCLAERFLCSLGHSPRPFCSSLSRGLYLLPAAVSSWKRCIHSTRVPNSSLPQQVGPQGSNHAAGAAAPTAQPASHLSAQFQWMEAVGQTHVRARRCVWGRWHKSATVSFWTHRGRLEGTNSLNET